jgi:hypothetical protein
MNKMTEYLALVMLNWWFPLGVVIGFGSKALWGGQIVSLSTGVCVGVLLYMLIQQHALQ